MLAKDKGATLTAMVEATGWLPHTTRAALTGLRKRGFAIERTGHEKIGSLYRIVAFRRLRPGPEPMAKPAAKRRPANVPAAFDLDADLAAVAAMNVEQVRGLWRQKRGEEPPPAFSKGLIARALAYWLQEEVLGGLQPRVRKLLNASSGGRSPPPRHVKVGSVIVREYQDKLHEFLVVPGAGRDRSMQASPTSLTRSAEPAGTGRASSAFTAARRRQSRTRPPGAGGERRRILSAIGIDQGGRPRGRRAGQKNLRRLSAARVDRRSRNRRSSRPKEKPERGLSDCWNQILPRCRGGSRRFIYAGPRSRRLGPRGEHRSRRRDIPRQRGRPRREAEEGRA